MDPVGILHTYQDILLADPAEKYGEYGLDSVS